MKTTLLVLVTGMILIAGCKKKDNETTTTPDPYASQKAQIRQTYADLAFAAYDDALITAEDLKDALYAFVDNPTAITHQAAKQAWLDAREVYGQTEIFRFAEGPID